MYGLQNHWFVSSSTVACAIWTVQLELHYMFVSSISPISCMPNGVCTYLWIYCVYVISHLRITTSRFDTLIARSNAITNIVTETEYQKFSISYRDRNSNWPIQLYPATEFAMCSTEVYCVHHICSSHCALLSNEYGAPRMNPVHLWCKICQIYTHSVCMPPQRNCCLHFNICTLAGQRERNVFASPTINQYYLIQFR